jgi:hypothetical protein
MKKLKYLLLLNLILACGKPSEYTSDEKKVDSLETEIVRLKMENDSLAEMLQNKSFKTKEYPKYFDSIEQPEVFILEKLREKQHLIPKKPVLGGTMHFTSISFINDHLILAEYEDGHIMGRAIYQYKMDKNGNLIFELLSELKD